MSDTQTLTDNTQTMLTTIDNPYSPIDQFDEWKRFDEQQKYYTCEYLARIAKTSDDLSEADQELAVQSAIDWIVKNDPLGIYRKSTI